METDALVNLVLAIDLARVGWFGLAVGVGVLGTLMFGRNYKKRIKAVEDKTNTPPVHVTQNISQAAGTEARASRRERRRVSCVRAAMSEV